MERIIKLEEVTGYDENGAEIIETVERKLKANALLPRRYRAQFGRDLVQDMNALINRYNKAVKALADNATEEEKQQAQFSVTDLTVFENVAWLMMQAAGEEVYSNPDEYLEHIPSMFSIYEVLPIILELWGLNNRTTSTP